MLTIRESKGLCTVVVTVDGTPELLTEMEAHARAGLEDFAAFPGFIAGALHRSSDGGRLVQYLQWASEADHQACMNDPCWDARDSTRRFMAHIDAGRARIDVRTYQVLRAISNA